MSARPTRGVVGRADHGDRAGPQQPGDRAALGPLLAPLDGVQIGRRRHDVEHDVHDPAVELPATGQPALANTVSIARLSASTSAVNRAMPFWRAMVARCSRSSVQNPRPWWASATAKATSASSLPGQRSYRASATRSSPSTATSAARSSMSTLVKCSSSATLSRVWARRTGSRPTRGEPGVEGATARRPTDRSAGCGRCPRRSGRHRRPKARPVGRQRPGRRLP